MIQAVHAGFLCLTTFGGTDLLEALAFAVAMFAAVLLVLLVPACAL